LFRFGHTYQPNAPFQERMLKAVHDVVLPVYKRAVRNYPWASQLWANYIRALVRTSLPLSLLQRPQR
jgi:hypothetical protein